MNGAEKDYQYGQKNNWRRWQWNRIHELTQSLAMSRRDVWVIYLGGEQNLDVPIAIDHGFRYDNMFCVERDDSAVRALRRSGQNTISENLADVVRNWPANRPVGLILADFCSGITESVSNFMMGAQSNPAFSTCILAANFMRGRDAAFNFNRQVIGDSLKISNHRGNLYYWYSWGVFCRFLMEGAGVSLKDAEWFRDISTVASPPHFNSYKSGVLTFDSVVMINPSFSMYSLFKNGITHEWNVETEKQSVLNKIRAAMAIRTQRMK